MHSTLQLKKKKPMPLFLFLAFLLLLSLCLKLFACISQSEDAIHENEIRVAIACMLIRMGAYCDVRNDSGRGPLTYGCSSMQEAVKEFMVSK